MANGDHQCARPAQRRHRPVAARRDPAPRPV